jgi:hypothetical protein
MKTHALKVVWQVDGFISPLYLCSGDSVTRKLKEGTMKFGRSLV